MVAERWLSREHELWQLSPAQEKIMESLGRGNMPGEAAKELNLKRNTVYTQLSRICTKMEARHWFHAHWIFERRGR